MDLLLMGLLVLASAGGGYATGRGGRRQGERLAVAVAALQERNSQIDEALGRHAVNSQQLKEGLVALKSDLDRRLHLFDVDLAAAVERLDEMGTSFASRLELGQIKLQELRRLLEEEGERVKELAVQQSLQGGAVQELNASGVNRLELERLAAVVQRLEHATESVSGNTTRVEALEMAQGIGDGRLSQLELRLAEATSHMANLAQDTLAAIGELKAEFAGELETMGDRVSKLDADQEELLKRLEQRLGEVQDFIIKAADDAKARREGLQAGLPSAAVPPAAVPPAAVPAGSVAELLAQQQALQQVFRQRRPGAPAVFPVVPREAGL